MKEVAGRVVDIGGTRAPGADLMGAEDLNFLALNLPGLDCTGSSCRMGCYHWGGQKIGMKGVETPWRYVVAKEADSFEDNSDSVLALLDAVLTVHTTTSLSGQADIHPDKGCYSASRVTEVNAENRHKCCTRN